MTTPARHSPVASLASLEYLQNQRRGSITDPSLHAAHITSGPKQFRLPSSSASSSSGLRPDSNSTRDPPVRPVSPYVFGNATPRPNELRKLLHSPTGSHRPTSPDSARSRSGSGMLSKDSELMNVDNDFHQSFTHRATRDPPSFDFTMRRHSIAVGQNPTSQSHLSPPFHGTKRKMSDDRGGFPPVGEDIDTPLVGPGVPREMDIDHDAPPLKRRGSTIDTQRIAQLSLNDRRNSIDSRSNWVSERRDSAPSLLPSVPGINSFTSNPTHSELPHGRIPSNLTSLSWSPNPSDPPGVSNGTNHNARQFDPMQSMSLQPPSGFPSDRRMSVPDILSHSSNSRTLRTRSRSPSRQNTDPHSGPPSGQDEPSGGATTPSNTTKSGKESGSTPYSRSPELRVSHKLAERKRRKEMKDLFDELRDQLPADRGMKASKWEILSKAIDFIIQLKRSHQEMAAELDMLRGQVRGPRQEGLPIYPSAGAPPLPAYGASIAASFPRPHIVQPHQIALNQSQAASSGSESSQNNIGPGKASTHAANGTRQD